jgi:transcriptional adapter 2-alpha
MSHVAGKNRKELQAMAKGRIDDKKEQNMKEEYPFSPPKVKVEDTQKGEFLLCMLYLVRI